MLHVPYYLFIFATTFFGERFESASFFEVAFFARCGDEGNFVFFWMMWLAWFVLLYLTRLILLRPSCSCEPKKRLPIVPVCYDRMHDSLVSNPVHIPRSGGRRRHQAGGVSSNAFFSLSLELLLVFDSSVQIYEVSVEHDQEKNDL